METPFRNNALVKDLLNTLQNTTKLCIASNLTLSSELVFTQTIKDWKQAILPDLHKKPTIFIIQA